MKNLFTLLLIIPFVFACSSDDKEDEIEMKTTIQFYSNDRSFADCLIGYFDEEGYCKKIADLGDIGPNNPSKVIDIDHLDIDEVFFFYHADYTNIPQRGEYGYKIVKKENNNFSLLRLLTMTVPDNDPKRYPH